MRKKLLIALAAMLILSLAISGTVAAYTVESDEAINIVTTGSVRLAVHEYRRDDSGQLIPYMDNLMVLPGAQADKIVVCENTGGSPAWVRVKLTVRILSGAGAQLDAAPVSLDGLNTDGWSYSDGYYYYSVPLQPGEVTAPVMTGVSFSGAMGNDYQGGTVQVDVEAQATQTANNGGTVLEARGWPVA